MAHVPRFFTLAGDRSAVRTDDRFKTLSETQVIHSEQVRKSASSSYNSMSPTMCHCRYQVEREIRIHIALEHEHIIKLYSAFEDEKNVYMVQEFAGSGDLFEELRRNGGIVKEKYAVRDVLAPFLNALHHLHSLVGVNLSPSTLI